MSRLRTTIGDAVTKGAMYVVAVMRARELVSDDYKPSNLVRAAVIYEPMYRLLTKSIESVTYMNQCIDCSQKPIENIKRMRPRTPCTLVVISTRTPP